MTRPSLSGRMRTVTLALALGLAPATAPVLAGLALGSLPVAADARPGFGGSFGSRGSRTFSAPPSTATNPGGASPFARTLTPSPAPYAPAYGGGGYGGMARTHPFGTGFAGGLLGAGLAGMLFGHGFFGGGYGYGGGFGGSGLLGMLIQLAILFFVARWLIRRVFGQRLASAGPAGAPFLAAGSARTGGGGGSAIPITPADYGQFEQALLDIQQAWSMQDLRSLARFATPEMVSYFSEQLTDLTSRNLRNVVSAVRMEHGDLSEAWSEGGREFATVAMRYSMIDVTTDLTGRVVDGSPNERQTVTELWTFVRARGGSWLLSAIQQAR